jgi:hypothetical protein
MPTHERALQKRQGKSAPAAHGWGARFRWVLLGRLIALTSSLWAASAHAQLALDAQFYYAMRFRPVIKTTLDEGRDEPFHPVSWKWFVTHTEVDLLSDLESKGLVPLIPVNELNQHPELILSLPNADAVATSKALAPGQTLPDPGYGMRFYDPAFEGGEPWSDVIHKGDGIYAHVEEIPNTHQINIEYTVLWTYNFADFSVHDGDITTVTAIYDKDSDLLVRLTYSIHGCLLQSFRIANPYTIGFRDIPGLGESGTSDTIRAAIVFVSTNDRAYSADGYCDVGFSASDPYVYLAADPDTGLYEHPVVFSEEGSHEPWPNESGAIYSVPAHTGDGVSFLPDCIDVLGTLAAPYPPDVPFLQFNGKWGSDPEGLIFHKSWFWPEGRANNHLFIPDNRFADKDPYDPAAGLGWPPQPENTHGAEVLYVDPKALDAQVVSAINNSLLTFPGLIPALSFVPKNGVLALDAGSYDGPVKITRPVQLVARGGRVTIGTGGARNSAAGARAPCASQPTS